MKNVKIPPKVHNFLFSLCSLCDVARFINTGFDYVYIISMFFNIKSLQFTVILDNRNQSGSNFQIYKIFVMKNTVSLLYSEHQEVAKCFKLSILAIVCCVLLALSVFLNGSLLLTFARYKSLHTRGNIFVIALTLVNFFGTIIEFPWIIVSNFYCRYIFFLI
jgi:hypothetical protein